MNINNNNYYKG